MNPRTEWLLKNERQVRKIAIFHGVPASELDDFCQELLLQSCRIQCASRKKESSFAAYSVAFVAWYARRYQRHNVPTEPLSANLSNRVSGEVSDRMEEVMDLGTNREKKVLEMKLDGYTNREIASEMEVSPARISSIFNTLRKKILKFFYS